MTTAAKKAPQDRKPAKKAAAKPKMSTPTPPEVSDVQAFKSRKKGRVIGLPSGLAVRAQRVDLQTFLKQGNVPNPLMEVIQESLNKGKAADVQKMVSNEEGEVDISLINEMYDMVNTVVCSTVLEPKVNDIPTRIGEDDEEEIVPIDEREEDPELAGRVFVDEIDDEDKMFLYQWAIGGTDDVATFRREAGADLASLSQS